MLKFIDLRSDTVTKPSEEMRKAMYMAEVGDDIMREDKTVHALEALSADILGKDDALFVASGTMANQIAVMALTNRGEEVIVGDTSHILNLEAGALAALSQVQPRVIEVPDGLYDIEKMKRLIQEPGVQYAKTSLICIENTNNLNAGLVVPHENIERVCALAKSKNVPVHMDGARIFNAALASKTSVKEMVKHVDSVMFALTKGLAAPFGAILAGERDYIAKARWMKQRIGGGFRQAGFLAAPGIVALNTMLPQLERDHMNAKLLGQGLKKLKMLNIDLSRIHTNIVTASIENLPITIDEFLCKLHDKGIKAKKISNTSFRMVTHYGIDESDVLKVVKSVDEIIQRLLEE